MTNQQMIAYSALAGFVAAGFVWYGWELVQNVKVFRERRKIKAARKAAAKAVETPPAAPGAPAKK